MCDTFVHRSSSGIIFGKNSDREPNEAQVLEYHAPASYPGGQSLQCTYITIPQAAKTHGVVLSRPFWMWGAEIGVNDKGVAIGNEAVWTKMPVHKENDSLTGMDLLRLALERGSTAQEALEVIVQLLADFGQGGICGYQDKSMGYHNSYIITDGNESWVLETSGHLWAALKVNDFYAISNGITIGEEMTRYHPDLVDTARQEGWLKKGQTFNFREVYGEWFYTTFSGCRVRQYRGQSVLNGGIGGVPQAFSYLRDHGEQGSDPSKGFLGSTICAHGANGLARAATQTTASLVVDYHDNDFIMWATGTAAPCTGLFKPLWFEGDVVPAPVGIPGATFSDKSLWWRHEKLHRQVLKDYSRLEQYRQERDNAESAFLEESRNVKPGKRFAAAKQAFDQGDQLENKWLREITLTRPKSRFTPVYNSFWKSQNRQAGLDI